MAQEKDDLPIIMTKHGVRIPDPGGDPATPAVNGSNQGGFMESNGSLVSTQQAGWRQLLINRGGAAVTT